MGEVNCICCGANEKQFIKLGEQRVCPFCGNLVDEDNLSLRAKEIIKESCRLRNKFQYIKALRLIKPLLEEEPKSPIYNWYALLAHYKITYINNGNGIQEATFLDTDVQTPINQSKYYRYISEMRRGIADKLQKSRMDYKEQALKVTDYDVFISYKKHDINDASRETKEAKWANQLYHYLDKLGYKVFYDAECLYKSNVEWEPHIYGALRKAKMLILCGSSIENIEAPWVKNEWKRFLAYKRQDKSKTICILGLNINPNDLPDSDLKLNQMVNADDGEWLQTLEGRVKDACRANSSVIEPKKKKNVEKLIELCDSFDKVKDANLDKIIFNLSNRGKRNKAIQAFNIIYKQSADNNDISSKEIALRYIIDNNLENIESLLSMDIFKGLTDKNIYSRVINKNDNKEFISKIISFVYKAIIANYDKPFASRLFLDVISYSHPERDLFVKNLFPLAANNHLSYQMFDKLLLILNQSPSEDLDCLIKYANLELKKQSYELANRYANLILNEYDKNNFRAFDIIFLSQNKSRSYDECFSFNKIMDTSMPINLATLKGLISSLGTNSFTCKKCNTRYARMIDGITYVCPQCGNTELKYERYYDSISILDTILNSIINGIPDFANSTSNDYPQPELINNAYCRILDELLNYYSPEERKYRISFIAKKVHEKKLFKAAIKYYLISLDSKALNENEIYYKLMLCDLECVATEDLYRIQIPLTDSKYYENLELSLAPGSEEAIKLKRLVDKQKEFIKIPNKKEAVAKRMKKPKNDKRKLILGEIFNTLLLAAFLAIHALISYHNIEEHLIILGGYSKLICKLLSAFTLFEILTGFFTNRIVKRKFFGYLFRFLSIAYLILIVLLNYGILSF